MRRPVLGFALGFLVTLLISLPNSEAAPREQFIPILGTTTEQTPAGSVAYIVATFEERKDHHGLLVRFHTQPGKFSRMARVSTEQAIRRTAHSLGLSTDSWTVELRIPYEGVTIYGDSLSAMVALSVAAMAQGKTVPNGYVLTGTVTPEGGIGPVGSLPLKVQAANAAKLRRVLVPDQKDSTHGDAQAPHSVQVSPVRSVPEAYEVLTDSPAPR